MSAIPTLSSTLRLQRSNSPTPCPPPPRMRISAIASSSHSAKSSTFYDVLRLKQNASQTEIKAAYRTLAKQYHPDTGTDGRDFIQIQEAYATLSDPAARAVYDRSIRPTLLRFGVSSSRWETEQCW